MRVGRARGGRLAIDIQKTSAKVPVWSFITNHFFIPPSLFHKVNLYGMHTIRVVCYHLSGRTVRVEVHTDGCDVAAAAATGFWNSWFKCECACWTLTKASFEPPVASGCVALAFLL